MEGYAVASSNLTDNTTMISRKNYVENVFNNFKNDGYDFKHISQMIIIIVCNKMDMTYDFYIKHNMPGVEWKLNAMINRDKSLINKFPRDWIHRLDRNFESYHVDQI